MKCRRLALSTLVLALAAQQPLIRVSTRLVEVNVIVRDKSGPVAGLTQSDFTIFDKGRQQKIAAFSVTSVKAVNQPVAPLEPGFFTNRREARGETPGSATIVLLDGINTQAQDQVFAKRQLIRFLKQIRPQDRVAVYALGARLRVLNDFTSDASRLAAVLAKYSGDNMGMVEGGSPDRAATDDAEVESILNESAGVVADNANINRVRNTIAAMEAIANHVARLPGRKNLVWVSGSFPFSIGQGRSDGPPNWEEDAQATQTAAPGSRKTAGGGGAGALYGVNIASGSPARASMSFNVEMERATRALNDANISVYPVDARGLVGVPKSMTAAGGPVTRASVTSQVQPQATLMPAGKSAMDFLAENTGGRAFYNTNDIQGAIRTALDDSEITYTLAFHPDSQLLDGRFHDLKVHVMRKDVELRFRRGYLALAEAPPDTQHAALELRDALWSPLESTVIGLTAGIVRAKPGAVEITVAIEPSDIVLRSQDGKWTGALDITFAQRTADGRDLGSAHQALGLNLDQARYDTVMRQGLTITKTLDVAAEGSQLRVVLYDRTSGKIGSLIVTLR